MKTFEINQESEIEQFYTNNIFNINGNLITNCDLELNKSFKIDGDFIVNGDLIIDSIFFNVDGNLEINGDINCNTNLIKKNLYVSGDYKANKNVEVYGNIQIDGDFTCCNLYCDELNINGDLYADIVNSTGDITILGNMEIKYSIKTLAKSIHKQNKIIVG